MVEAEKHKFVAHLNQRLETMIKEVVVAKVKERVKAQASFCIENILEMSVYTVPKGGGTRRALSEGSARKQRSRYAKPDVPRKYVSQPYPRWPVPNTTLIRFFSEAKNRNATIRSRFPREPITPIHRPISVEFQIQKSPTDSPRVGPVGGYNPSPSPKFPESFGALINLSLADSVTLLKDYGLEAASNGKKVQEEDRLDNLNKLMSYFGVSFRTSPMLSVFIHPIVSNRLAIACILGQRGKGRSLLVYGTADEYLGTVRPLIVRLRFWLCCIITCIT